MGKKKSKNNQDDFWDPSQEDVAVESVEFGVTPVVDAVPAAESASTAPTDEAEGGLMAMMSAASAKKKNKKQQEQKEVDTDAPIDPDAPPVEVKIKSKKEKERERKERQKLEQKKKNAPKGGADKVDTPPDSPQAQVGESKVDAPLTAGPAAAKKGKKKGVPPVAALREFLAAKQAAEEAEAKRIEEEERREAERLRKIEEEEKAKEEAKRLKKEREKERIEQLKREGKYVTEAERKKRALAQQKLEAMRAAGMIVPALDKPLDESGEENKKRVVYDNRKKRGGKKDVKKSEQVEIAAPIVEVKKPEVEEPVDSWEEVADSWEEIEEEEVKPSAGAANDGERDTEDDEDDESSEDESSDDGMTVAERQREAKLAEARERREKRHEEALAARSAENLRSPICVILGHVDTGKTKLLDKIRQTNVQEGEAGGITQQIGATYFPTESIEKKTQVVKDSKLYGDIPEKSGFSQNFEFKVPGLLIIDTPGHESFTNLRSRGSSLCNIAILVVDIMHGLEPQTIESINLLKARKTPFIVALNKIDRIYDWKSIPNNAFLDSFEAQSKSVKKEFANRLEDAKVAFAEQGLNAELFTQNKDVRKYVSLVPTSAITGEGIPDLLMLLTQLTQNRLTDSLMYLSELEATVLEVKVIEGHGTTIDVILSNGILREGDRIVICGLNGPISTNIRALLTPQPMRELRVKSAYVHHKEIKAAMGIKISAPDLEKAIAGSRLLVVTKDDDEDEMRDEVMGDLTDLFESVDKSGRGVCVQASTLGSLEALLSFLKDSKIPVAGINIGPVHKKDVIRASVMLEHAKEFATILAFDVKIDKEVSDLAEEMHVKIFRADIIYHLFDQFTAYMKNIQDEKRKEMAPSAIWPCTLRIVPGCIFNKKDPIILGVDVLEGSVRIGTPVCVPSKGNIVLGKIAGIEAQHKAVEIAKKGQQVAVRIETPLNETARIAGRHFMEGDELISRISRGSIDILKASFRDEVSKDEWLLIKKFKAI
eukprot:Partr_v1_DN27998_c2_g1_i1_m11076 putative Translation Initiation Factor